MPKIGAFFSPFVSIYFCLFCALVLYVVSVTLMTIRTVCIMTTSSFAACKKEHQQKNNNTKTKTKKEEKGSLAIGCFKHCLTLYTPLHCVHKSCKSQLYIRVSVYGDFALHSSRNWKKSRRRFPWWWWQVYSARHSLTQTNQPHEFGTLTPAKVWLQSRGN